MRYFLLILSLLATFLLFGCGEESNKKMAASNPSVQENQLEKASFTITGFTWSSCSITAGAAVKSLTGVKEASIEPSGEATISFDSSQVSLDEIKQVIIDLGYGIK